jgi:hypothetical protein
MRLLFSCKTELTAHCLIFFDTVENESSILNWRQHKPPSYQAAPYAKLKL